MLETYQNLPSLIDPVIFTIGPVSIHWYSVMWLLAFAMVYFFLAWLRKKESLAISKDQLLDTIFNGLFGALIGGRLGYVLFYDLPYYVQDPISIISPYNFETQIFTGIFGMSFHGGVIGVIIALWYSVRKYNLAFWMLADLVALVAPLGYFWGRIGNFLNNELFGRVTDASIGMNFGDGNLRHPSQLYEALGEGLLLFVILWSIRKKQWVKHPGVMSSLFIIGYGAIRFVIEFFREPDAHLSFVFMQFTMGQVLSLLMVLGGCGLYFFVKRRS